MFRTKYLRWFRDKGRGQEASDHFEATESMDGNWPIASLSFNTEKERERMWDQLYNDYGVNALAVYND